MTTGSSRTYQTSAADRQRRIRLRVAAKLLGYIAMAVSLYVLLAALRSGGHESTELQILRVDLSDLPVGEARLLAWDGRPVIVYRRSDDDIATLRTTDARLQDPRSRHSIQPMDLQIPLRSQSAELFVAIALGTDLGCTIDYLPASDERFQDTRWSGGFVDSCRKSRYDLAGRVFRSQYAERNLSVPEHTFSGDTLVLGQQSRHQ